MNNVVIENYVDFGQQCDIDDNNGQVVQLCFGGCCCVEYQKWFFFRCLLFIMLIGWNKRIRIKNRKVKVFLQLFSLGKIVMVIILVKLRIKLFSIVLVMLLILFSMVVVKVFRLISMFIRGLIVGQLMEQNMLLSVVRLLLRVKIREMIWLVLMFIRCMVLMLKVIVWIVILQWVWYSSQRIVSSSRMVISGIIYVMLVMMMLLKVWVWLKKLGVEKKCELLLNSMLNRFLRKKLMLMVVISMEIFEV